MRKLTLTAILLLSAPVYALAATDPAQLQSCLVQNSGAEEDQSFKALMIALLQDDIPNAKQITMKFGLQLVNMAMQKCGVPVDELQSPPVSESFSKYGEYMGQKIVGEAMKKLNMQ